MRPMTRRDRSHGLATTRRLIIAGAALVLVGSAAELQQAVDDGSTRPSQIEAADAPQGRTNPPGSASPTISSGAAIPARGSGSTPDGSTPDGSTPAATEPGTTAPSPTPEAVESTTSEPTASRTAAASRSARRASPSTSAPSTTSPSGTPTPSPTTQSPSPTPASPSPTPSPSDDEDDSVLGNLLGLFGNGAHRTGS